VGKTADGLSVHRPAILNTGVLVWIRFRRSTQFVHFSWEGDPDSGWGRINETWNVLDNLKRMGLPDWFQLGDADLATHIVRTARYNDGWTLSQVTKEFCKQWGIQVQVLPMSDDKIQTWVHTDQGDLEFQEYFVHRKCQPIVKGFNFAGAKDSKPARGILEAIEVADAIIICPSNPWVSIDPILAVPGIKPALAGHLILGVSPIIGDQTVKGPAAKMFSEMGIKPSALAVANHYRDIIDTLILDDSDSYLVDDITDLGIRTHLTRILMHDRLDRGRLANELIEVIKDLGR
jgi:LPPG:FO 2-phospho-L-lactate transferase